MNIYFRFLVINLLQKIKSQACCLSSRVLACQGRMDGKPMPDQLHLCSPGSKQDRHCHVHTTSEIRQTLKTGQSHVIRSIKRLESRNITTIHHATSYFNLPHCIITCLLIKQWEEITKMLTACIFQTS